MKNAFDISCIIDNTDRAVPLGMEIWINNQQIFNQDSISESQTVNYQFSDDDAEHELRFVMKNKTTDHTKVDESGTIIKDACLIISNLSFDKIALEQLFIEKAVYHHDFNGSGNQIQDKFFGQMGCNGTVSLKFTTPMYLWLLENV
jgi:hypothetical protein